MTVSTHTPEPGIAVVTVSAPPVNALSVQGWFDLAAAIEKAGRDEAVHVVVLRAEGRGFNAGVDIKEIQRDPGYGSLIGANEGCAAAFSAVYDCAVPVIAAVHGFCLGGGVGLVGNADIVVASEDAGFGAATHLARLVPQHLMRALYYTASKISAAQLHHHGSGYAVVPREELDETALAVARQIAAKDTRVIRAAKQAINGIDVQPVHRSYRFEQGFTFQLNLAGVSDGARQEFLEKGKP